ncbi:MAG TPA: hypothetical protein VJ768_09440 [Anaerolineales bacterium]|nr:hypothetical protein [Anaerolineales bacterium]
MAGRFILVHWNEAEAQVLAEALRKAGWQIETVSDHGGQWLKNLRQDPPHALLISLRRLPSHGREVADALWYSKWGRQISIVFFDGAEEKVAKLREQFQDAVFTTWEELPQDLAQLGAQDRAIKSQES